MQIQARVYICLGLGLILISWGAGIWLMRYSNPDAHSYPELYPYQTLGFALTVVGGVIGSLVMSFGASKRGKLLREIILKEVGQYFSKCPLCHAGFDSMQITWTYRPTISCLKCGARWTAGFSYWTGKFEWAQLKRENIWGEGTQYLDIKYEPEVWRQLAVAQPSVDVKKDLGYSPKLQAQKYREYLQKLEEKHRSGEVSEEIYLKLKNEYLRKIEEMERTYVGG